MVAGSPQFVRCIKPNDIKEAKCFEPQKVIKQLRYTGVLETIRIRQHGFSHRYTFAEFLKRYCFLAFGFDEKVLISRENCRLLLIRLKLDGWALGKSKVFLKYYHVEFLAKVFEEQIRKVVIVQACVRRWLAKLKYRKNKHRMDSSVVTLQRHVRGWLTRRRIEVQRLRELEIQEIIRRQQVEEEEKRKQEKMGRSHVVLNSFTNVHIYCCNKFLCAAIESKAKKAFAKAKLLKKLSSQDLMKTDENVTAKLKNKENINLEKAAAVIQSRKFSPHRFMNLS